MGLPPRNPWEELSTLPRWIYWPLVLAPLVPVLIVALLEIQRKREEKLHPSPAGCRKVGWSESGLEDQYDKKYAEELAPDKPPFESARRRVKALFIYPVKSCRGVEVRGCQVLRTGLAFDRQFAFAQLSSTLPDSQGRCEHPWTLITQRQFPLMSQVQTEVWIPNPKAADYSSEGEWVRSKGCIVVKFPFTPAVSFTLAGLWNFLDIILAMVAGFSFSAEPILSFKIPFSPPEERAHEKGYATENMKIWNENPELINMGCEIPADTLARLKYFLGVRNPLTLFRIGAGKYREVLRCSPAKEDYGYQPIHALSDNHPLHLLNLASVHGVASRLPQKYPKKLDARRFRSNIYITGPPAFAEDNWARIRIGDTSYRACCLTTRCKLPNVDPATGEPDVNEPYTTLRKHRLLKEISTLRPCLGVQMCPELGDPAGGDFLGAIQVGDEVEVLETRD